MNLILWIKSASLFSLIQPLFYKILSKSKTKPGLNLQEVPVSLQHLEKYLYMKPQHLDTLHTEWMLLIIVTFPLKEGTKTWEVKNLTENSVSWYCVISMIVKPTNFRILWFLLGEKKKKKVYQLHMLYIPGYEFPRLGESESWGD